MLKFVWRDEYNVGISKVDSQHQGLVTLLNQLHESVLDGKANEIVEETLNQLIAYTETHFKEEETLMKEYGYPGYEEHCAIHAAGIREVRRMQQKHLQGEASIVMELAVFLMAWLRKHILETDMAYSGYLKDKGVE